MLTREEQALVDAVCESLQREPEMWRCSEYSVGHGSAKLDIWISNGVGQTAIRDWNGNHVLNRPYSRWSRFSPWRRKLWRATRPIVRAAAEKAVANRRKALEDAAASLKPASSPSTNVTIPNNQLATSRRLRRSP